MTNNFPHEIIINGVYFSPLLLVFVMAFIAVTISVVHSDSKLYLQCERITND